MSCPREHTSFLLHCPLNGSKRILYASVVRVVLQPLLICIAGAKQVTCTVESSTLPTPSSRPVRLDLGCLFGIFQSICPVLLRSIGGGPVAVENVVGGFNFNGFSEGITVRDHRLAHGLPHICVDGKQSLYLGGLHGFVELLLGNCLVAESLKLVCRRHDGLVCCCEEPEVGNVSMGIDMGITVVQEEKTLERSWEKMRGSSKQTTKNKKNCWICW